MLGTLITRARSSLSGKGRQNRPRLRPTLELLERRQLLSAELTESNAASWATFASDGAATSVVLDTVHVKEGSNSIKFHTDSGFDTGVSYPVGGGAHWDLSGDNLMEFWAFADNQTPIGFQGNQPIIVLNTAGGSFRYEPQHQQMPNQGWQHFFIPLAGSSEWVRTTTGSPTLSDVNSFEIHQDTWDYGFDVSYDGLRFENLSTAPGPPPPAGVNPDAISPKVLLFVYDPIMENKGGLRQHQVYGGQDPIALTNQVVADLRTDSHGLANYQIVDTQVVDAYPYLQDGFRYDDASYDLAVTTGQFHNDAHGFPNSHFDYNRFIADNNIASRIASGEIDEVWLWTGNTDASQTWESTMAGDGAYWCNSSPVPNVPSPRAFVIMGWNFERGVAEALHSFGHRTESIMAHDYGRWEHDQADNWSKFTLLDKDAPGLGGVGDVHFPVNGASDYDYDNHTVVTSNADDWYNYPNFQGITRQINSDEWSPTHVDPQRDYLNWWYDHMPHMSGVGLDHYLADWWRYITDADQFKEGTEGNLDGTLGVSEVQITGLTSGAAVSGVVPLHAEAVTDGALGRVDFYVDGQYLGTDTMAPYSVSWDTQSWAPGNHTIVAKSYELQHQSESVSSPITVVITGMPSVADAGFEQVMVGAGQFQYHPTGSPWTFTGGAGLSGNNSGFTAGNPAAPEGIQVAFLQTTGSFTQTVTGWAAGSYVLTFDAAQRGNHQASRQDFEVLVDGVIVVTFTPTGTSYQSYSTAAFTVTAGSHTIKFQGLDSAGGDNTAFVDAVAQAQATPAMIGDAGFEQVQVGAGNYQYRPIGSPWTFTGGAGISGNNSAFTSGNPSAPEGAQVAFLQTTGAFSQSVSGWAAGSYTLSFKAAQRGNHQASRQDFNVLVDGVVVGTFTPSGTSYQSYTTAVFTVTAGAHTIKFQGLDTAGGDNTTFVDQTAIVQASSSPVADAGFEQVLVGAGQFQYRPTGSPWTFTGGAGLSGNNSGFTSGNPPAPEGVQVAFLQNTGSFSESVSGWAAGSYTLSFKAAQRGNYQASRQDFNVLVDGVVVGTFTPTGTSYQTYTTAVFAVTAGSHTIKFQALDSAGGDNTAFVDQVAITPT